MRKERWLTSLILMPERIARIMALIDDLTAQVEENNNVIESAITLIQNIKAKLDEAGTDPAKLQALKDALSTQDAKLAAAVASNTPQAEAMAQQQAELSGADAVAAQNAQAAGRTSDRG
jgi:chromosome segregation ATPase